MSEENNNEGQNIAPAIVPLLTEDETKEFAAYLRGETSQPPACVSKIMTSVANKLVMVAGCDMIGTIERERVLDKFMSEAEARLFDTALIPDMPNEDLQKLYEKAAKRKGTLAEARRKFLAQNRDSLSIPGSAQEKLLTQIMTMSPEQLEKLKTAVAQIASETVDSPDQTSPEAVAENLQ